MKIAIVGATGILGKYLINFLIDDGHEIVAFVRSIEKAKRILSGSARLVKFDLLEDNNEDILMEALNSCDAAVHAATSIPVDPEKPGAWDANTKLRTYGTKKYLNAAVKTGVKKYIQQSIVMAYPDNGDNWITEDIPLDTSLSRKNVCQPVNEMEKMIKALPEEKLQWNILRGGLFVGKGTFQERKLENIKKGIEVITGDGSNYISFIHVKDMARAILKTIDSNLSGKILNIVDNPIRQKDYTERLCVIFGEGSYIINRNLPNPPSHRCSNNLAKNLLNWLPEEDIFSLS